MKARTFGDKWRECGYTAWIAVSVGTNAGSSEAKVAPCSRIQPDDEARQVDDAEALQCGGSQYVAIVRMEPALDLDRRGRRPG